MSEIRFHCQECRKVIAALASQQDSPLRCPACSALNVVPPLGRLQSIEIYFACGRCEGDIEVKAAAQGRVVKCPHCRDLTVVPTPEPATAVSRTGAKSGRPGNGSPLLTSEEISFLSSRTRSA